MTCKADQRVSVASAIIYAGAKSATADEMAKITRFKLGMRGYRLAVADVR